MGNPIKKIARDYRVKLFVQKLVSFLPEELGFQVNEKLVQLTRGKQDPGFYRFRFEKGLNNIQLLKKFGFDFYDATILELGTGWHAIDLILFYLVGSQKIYTVDHHLHLNDHTLREVLRVLFDDGLWSNKIIAESVNPVLRERVERLMALKEQNITVELFLNTINVKFFKSKSCLVINIKEIVDVDLFYTESVLQRIPTKDLQVNLRHIARSCLKPGAYSFHRTDQKDINAQDHVDNTLWKFKYLKYNDKYWNLISCRFNYQNRWRESDFVQTLENVGLSTIDIISECEEADLLKMKTFKVADLFQPYDLKDLATKSSIIISKN